MPNARNHLITLLPAEDRARLLSACEKVEMTLGQVIAVSGMRTPHVYFPETGLISLETIIDRHAGLQVGMVGREGVVGADHAPEVPFSTLRASVQGAGLAWRVDSATFRLQLSHSPALQSLMEHYHHVAIAQLALSMGCQRFHLLGARFARWLLMRHDHAQSNSFVVTHESLGHLLGVRRVSVTIEAGALQAQGVIAYSRGALTVLDRRGLEKAACGCYAKSRKIYAGFLSAASAGKSPSRLGRNP